MSKRTSNISRLFASHLSKALQDCSMSRMITVRKVETGDIHTGIHELSEAFLTPTAWTNRTEDLGSAIFRDGWPFDHIQGDETTCERGNVCGIGNHDESIAILGILKIGFSNNGDVVGTME
jgi:hypothetical protein